MFNVAMFLINLFFFFWCWGYSDKTGSLFGWFITVVCGVACCLQIIIIGIS